MLIGKLSRLHFDFIRAGGSRLQGPNSIEFVLEKSLEFWLEIPHIKKMFKKWCSSLIRVSHILTNV